jgi:hypothetical protein
MFTINGPLTGRHGATGVIALLAVAVGVGSVAAASEAAAVTYTGNDPIDCSSPGSFVVDGVSGDSFSVNFSGCKAGGPYLTLTYDTALLSATLSSGATITSNQTVTFTIRPGVSPAMYTAAVTLVQSGSADIYLGRLNVLSSGAGAAPPPWLQSYALSDGANGCAEGWSPSWAAWPNEGTGGPVCNRVVLYDNGEWKVSADLVLGEGSSAWDGGTSP